MLGRDYKGEYLSNNVLYLITGTILLVLASFCITNNTIFYILLCQMPEDEGLP